MSGTHPTPAEHHLGDRLAALVDGELGHDARERVLAHLATCARCKAEADAQRRVKSVFAESPPPAPPAALLARLQGLPGGAAGDGDRGDGGDGGAPFGGPVFGVRPGSAFGYVPAVQPADEADRASRLPGGTRTGFRIHEVGRAEAERSPWLGRRFAFAAASAVSFAAIALGGTLPTVSVVDARGDGSGNSVTPLRSSPGGPAAPSAGPDGNRRRGGATGLSGMGTGVGASTGMGRLAERVGAAPPSPQPGPPPFLHATAPLAGGLGLNAVPLLARPTPTPSPTPTPPYMAVPPP